MKSKKPEIKKLIDEYTKEQEKYDKFDSTSSDMYEHQYHLRQIHRLLYLICDILYDK